MTTSSPSSNKLNQWPLILALVLVGLNLRPPMAAIGPLLSDIQASIPSSFTLIALLTMLPILAIGLAVFYGGQLANKIGEHKAIALALSVIGLASLVRLYTNDTVDLILTAMVAGLGIAIIQAIMPAIIKDQFPGKAPLLMGVYITAIMGGAALAASTVAIISELTGNWRVALAVWSALAAIALAAWFAISQEFTLDFKEKHPQIIRESFFRIPRAWLLGVFFGLCTASYTCVLAWLPPFYTEQGMSQMESGFLLAFLTCMEVVAGLSAPVLVNRSEDRRRILYYLLLFIIVGFTGLLLAPVTYAVLWTGLLGLGIGGLFPLSLIIAMDHIKDPQGAGQLTAFVQGIGYLIAAFSPLIAGYIHDVFASFNLAWLVLILINISMLGMAWCFNPLTYASALTHKKNEK